MGSEMCIRDRSCSAMADTLSEAARLAYSLMDKIDLEGSFYRLDIGGKAL